MLELFRGLGHQRGEAEASINLGELLFLSSAYREARGYFNEALGIARDIDTPVEEAWALEGIGLCHVQEGNLAKAPQTCDRPLSSTAHRRPEAQSVERPSSPNSMIIYGARRARSHGPRVSQVSRGITAAGRALWLR